MCLWKVNPAFCSDIHCGICCFLDAMEYNKIRMRIRSTHMTWKPNEKPVEFNKNSWLTNDEIRLRNSLNLWVEFKNTHTQRSCQAPAFVWVLQWAHNKYYKTTTFHEICRDELKTFTLLVFEGGEKWKTDPLLSSWEPAYFRFLLNIFYWRRSQGKKLELWENGNL